jgi:biopolymer transport protein TolR
MKHKRHKRRKIADINVVPYIDVMLVLLIIFMVTTPLLSQGVKVNLPKAAAKVLPQENVPPIIVSVDHTGNDFLNISSTPNSPITTADLQTQVSAALQIHPDRKVYVRADESVQYGDVIRAMALLQQSGADTVGLMTDNPSNKPS